MLCYVMLKQVIPENEPGGWLKNYYVKFVFCLAPPFRSSQSNLTGRTAARGVGNGRSLPSASPSTGVDGCRRPVPCPAETLDGDRRVWPRRGQARSPVPAAGCGRRQESPQAKGGGHRGLECPWPRPVDAAAAAAQTEQPAPPAPVLHASERAKRLKAEHNLPNVATAAVCARTGEGAAVAAGTRQRGARNALAP